MDILLDRDGDIAFSATGDLVFEDSVRQKIQIRLRWFYGEWRWHPSSGLDYWGKVLIKGAKEDVIRKEVRRVLKDIDEITSLDVAVNWNKAKRTAKITVTAKTDSETIREEVEIDGSIRSNGERLRSQASG